VTPRYVKSEARGLSSAPCSSKAPPASSPRKHSPAKCQHSGFFIVIEARMATVHTEISTDHALGAHSNNLLQAKG